MNALPPGWSIRPAVAADMPRLRELMHELGTLEGSAADIRTDVATLASDCAATPPRFHALLAEYDGRTCGYATYTLGYSIWRGQSVILLDDLFVVPEHRSRGIGRLLMQELAAIRDRDGHGFVRWGVESANSRAVEFYRALGARVTYKGICTWAAA